MFVNQQYNIYIKSLTQLLGRGSDNTWPATTGWRVAKTLKGAMVPGRCLPADLWLLRGATTCTMFTTCVISWCDNSPTGSSTNCGCDAWNRTHVYLVRNRGRCCKSVQSFSHSKLGAHNEFTCKTKLLRSNLQPDRAAQRVCSALVLDACAWHTHTSSVSHASTSLRTSSFGSCACIHCNCE